ncbi:hypothetical protein CN918_29345 [Priestia megaterium]|nr:hypothetical protein CN918_29345 [Priestia megaterium]
MHAQNKKRIEDEIKRLNKENPGIKKGILRLGLLQGFVMKMMYEAKNHEEAKEIYDTYNSITYNTAV